MLVFKFVSSATNPDLLNPCTTSRCQNFAKCVPLNSFNYTCECTNSSIWTGAYCEQPAALNLCVSSPCKQGSTCLFDVSFNVYSCVCQLGYTGLACDKIVDQCQSYPCKNRVIIIFLI